MADVAVIFHWPPLAS
ncbi:GpE family phage tail protein [Escherichia coli]